ncbi:uncharacterized protein LOC112147832 [Oryzias melastigma]|uniref:uncharacterized protein LOC112147832 n=1 Tax=Oryzias melastigma TaxID=30732 RepID=UPI000CF80D0B|nr:uncharacterized protein LOC112147832 [Oryzias melastigma]
MTPHQLIYFYKETYSTITIWQKTRRLWSSTARLFLQLGTCRQTSMEGFVLAPARAGTQKGTSANDQTEEPKEPQEYSKCYYTGRPVRMCHETHDNVADCLRHGTTIMEKTEVVSDCLSCYINYCNSSVIVRFKEGLSTLQFLPALQQHPALLAPVLCFQDKPLPAVELQRLFPADLSPQGSNTVGGARSVRHEASGRITS